MGRNSARHRLAARFTHPRLVTDAGTVFVPPRPIDLERHFSGDDDEEGPDRSLSAYEQLLDTEQYHLVLSLSWGSLTAPGQTLDLGLLHVDADKLFVVHQVNDDAGTALILAHLSTGVVGRLFGHFLVDYLSSRGTGYAVHLPGLLPHTIWIARPELAPHATVAAGLLGLVGPGGQTWGDPHGGAGPYDLRRGVSLMA